MRRRWLRARGAHPRALGRGAARGVRAHALRRSSSACGELGHDNAERAEGCCHGKTVVRIGVVRGIRMGVRLDRQHLSTLVQGAVEIAQRLASDQHRKTVLGADRRLLRNVDRPAAQLAVGPVGVSAPDDDPLVTFRASLGEQTQFLDCQRSGYRDAADIEQPSG